jgi:pSer/pThr/pTyr-binding forkhead associated (FHA) protein
MDASIKSKPFLFGRSMMKVTLTNARVPEQTIEIIDLPAMIGCSKVADVCLDDLGVAELQCVIDHDGMGVIVTNLAGGSGTFVNGIAVSKAALTPGDVLTVGTTDLVVEWEYRGRGNRQYAAGFSRC